MTRKYAETIIPVSPAAGRQEHQSALPRGLLERRAVRQPRKSADLRRLGDPCRKEDGQHVLGSKAGCRGRRTHDPTRII